MNSAHSRSGALADVARGGGEYRIGRKLFLGTLGIGALGVTSGSLLSPAVTAVRGTILPASGFTIYTVAPMPSFDPARWRLSVGGLVDRVLSLSYADVLHLPALAAVRDYQCVTGWVVPHVHWQGVALQTLARLAGARPSARFINVYSSDGLYSESLRLPSQAFQPAVMLGYALDGQPLAREQGAPLRLVVPQMYGYKYAKWIDRVEFSDRQEIGYWERSGYAIDAYVGQTSTPFVGPQSSFLVPQR
jgi:DMSO/TMAO reductase YedYZ molybdopterin-dependent catalytic subunit